MQSKISPSAQIRHYKEGRPVIMRPSMRDRSFGFRGPSQNLLLARRHRALIDGRRRLYLNVAVDRWRCSCGTLAAIQPFSSPQVYPYPPSLLRVGVEGEARLTVLFMLLPFARGPLRTGCRYRFLAEHLPRNFSFQRRHRDL